MLANQGTAVTRTKLLGLRGIFLHKTAKTRSFTWTRNLHNSRNDKMIRDSEMRSLRPVARVLVIDQ
jgi:hypothetical protein